MDKNQIILELRSQAMSLLNQVKAIQDQAESLLKSADIIEAQLKAEADAQGQIGPGKTFAQPPSPKKPFRAQRGTRVLQVKTALRFGPLTRSEVQRASRIPKGSLDHILREGEDFGKNEEGRWFLKEKPAIAALSATVLKISQGDQR